MAAPTEVRTNLPHITINVTGSNVDAGNNDYVVGYQQAKFKNGFSIVTGTLTAMTVTVLAQNGSTAVDITNDLFSVANLASDSAYLADINIPCEKIIIRAVRSNATNAVDFTATFPNGR